MSHIVERSEIPHSESWRSIVSLPDGTRALSADEKAERGRRAVEALSMFRQAREKGDNIAMEDARKRLDADMPYFGYGYISHPEMLVPNVWLLFWAFRVMVGFGIYFIAFFVLVLFLVWKAKYNRFRWLQWIALFSIPCAYLASHAGWIVAEVGRQPWAIQDMLPINAAISKLEVGTVQTTFFIFLVMFTVLLIAEIGIMLKAIRKGPEA